MLPTLLAWTHDLDPFVFRTSGGFGVRWYGLSYVAAFLIAWLWLYALARRGLILIKPDSVADIILAHVVGVMLGGRIGFVLFYQPSLLVSFDSHFPWWGAIDISNGGMSSHGGMIGIILASLWVARHYSLPALHVLDCIAAVAPAGCFLGRIANFVNAELLGRIVALPGQPAPWWAVRFPSELLDRYDELNPTPEQRHQLTALLRDHFGLNAQPTPDAIAALIAKIHAGDTAARDALTPLLSARHPSQLYQAVAEGLVTLAVVWFIWRRPRRPGVIFAAVLITYAVGRIATEFVRLPDTQFAVPRPYGLSRGQWLSVLMLLAGVAVLALSLRTRSAPLIGGWLTPRATRPPTPPSPSHPPSPLLLPSR